MPNCIFFTYLLHLCDIYPPWKCWTVMFWACLTVRLPPTYGNHFSVHVFRKGMISTGNTCTTLPFLRLIEITVGKDKTIVKGILSLNGCDVFLVQSCLIMRMILYCYKLCTQTSIRYTRIVDKYSSHSTCNGYMCRSLSRLFSRILIKPNQSRLLD